MLSPEAAFARIMESGPFDDPTVPSYPYRWFLASDGVLCRAAWRALPQRYERFKFDGVVIFGSPHHREGGVIVTPRTTPSTSLFAETTSMHDLCDGRSF